MLQHVYKGEIGRLKLSGQISSPFLIEDVLEKVCVLTAITFASFQYEATENFREGIYVKLCAAGGISQYDVA